MVPFASADAVPRYRSQSDRRRRLCNAGCATTSRTDERSTNALAGLAEASGGRDPNQARGRIGPEGTVVAAAPRRPLVDGDRLCRESAHFSESLAREIEFPSLCDAGLVQPLMTELRARPVKCRMTVSRFTPNCAAMTLIVAPDSHAATIRATFSGVIEFGTQVTR